MKSSKRFIESQLISKVDDTRWYRRDRDCSFLASNLICRHNLSLCKGQSAALCCILILHACHNPQGRLIYERTLDDGSVSRT